MSDNDDRFRIPNRGFKPFGRQSDASRRSFLRYVLGGVAGAAVTPFGRRASARPGSGLDDGGVTASATQGNLSVKSTTALDPGLTDVMTAFGFVWVTGYDTLFRVDPRTGGVSTLPLPGLNYATLTASPTDIWVNHDVTKVSRVDPKSNQLLATIEVGPYTKAVAFGGGFVWVALEELTADTPGTVIRIDPRTNALLPPAVPVGKGPCWLFFGAGHLWVTLTDFGGSLVKMHPVTGAVIARIPEVRTSVSEGNNRLFGNTGFGSIVEIEPNAGAVVDLVGVERVWEVVFVGGLLWALSLGGSKEEDAYIPDPAQPVRLRSIRPGTWETYQTLDLGTGPTHLAVDRDAAWVAESGTGTLSRIA